MTFKSLGLSSPLLKAIKIVAMLSRRLCKKAIPMILNGSDMVVSLEQVLVKLPVSLCLS